MNNNFISKISQKNVARYEFKQNILLDQLLQDLQIS